jgi:hypothetical protein
MDDFLAYALRPDAILTIFYKSADAEIDIRNDRGEINVWKQRPVLSQLYFLHVSFNDDNWYKWYSDLFALGMLTIDTTGLFLIRGKYSFRKRG